MKQIFSSLCLVAAVLMVCSCNSGNQGGNHAGRFSDSSASALPRPDHVVIVIEENHDYDQVIHSPMAPYINSLATEGVLFTHSHGVVHPSQPNYIALFSGDLQGVKGDECLDVDSLTPYATPNLGAALLAKGLTFGGYSQTLPADTFMGCYYGKSKLNGGSLYGRKHCPWVNWIGDGENQLPVEVNHVMAEFPKDFDQLPTISFVIPDMDHDMHNNSSDSTMITKADDWLKANLGDYIQWAKTHNSLFILTFDEDDFTPQNRIPTLFVGPMVQPGQYADSINHYHVLRTLEEMYGLSPSGSAQATAIAGIWKP